MPPYPLPARADSPVPHRHLDERRPDEPVVQEVTLLEHLEDRVRRHRRRSPRSRPPRAGSDRRRRRCRLGIRPYRFQSSPSCLRMITMPCPKSLSSSSGARVLERALEVVEDRQEVVHESGERDLEVLRALALAALLVVLELRELADVAVLELLEVLLDRLELLLAPPSARRASSSASAASSDLAGVLDLDRGPRAAPGSPRRGRSFARPPPARSSSRRSSRSETARPSSSTTGITRGYSRRAGPMTPSIPVSVSPVPYEVKTAESRGSDGVVVLGAENDARSAANRGSARPGRGARAFSSKAWKILLSETTSENSGFSSRRAVPSKNRLLLARPSSRAPGARARRARSRIRSASARFSRPSPRAAAGAPRGASARRTRASGARDSASSSAGVYVDVGLEHPRDDDVRIVDLDDQDLARARPPGSAGSCTTVCRASGATTKPTSPESCESRREAAGRDGVTSPPAEVEVRVDLLADVVGDLALAHQLVDVEAVGPVGRHPAGRGVRLREEARRRSGPP